MFTTSIFGTHFYNSFFATLERLQGVVYWLFLLVYILLLKFYFRTSKDWMAFFKITILVSFVASIYAILQKFSLIDVFHSGIDRAEGTLGNAAFLGSYLLLAVILGFWLFLREQNKIWKYSILIINLFNIFVLYLTLTRSALLALLVFFTVWIFTGASSFSRKYKMISRGVLALMLILVVLSIIFRDYLANLDNDIINRLFVISLDSPVIKNRLLVWQGALQNIGNYFWLGLGMNNFDVLFNKLSKLKKEGLVKKIGFSTYTPEHVDLLLDNFEFDLIQLPFNIFDVRLIEGGQLQALKNKGVEIHARSVFLQGVLLDFDNLSDYFLSWKKQFNKYQIMVENSGFSLLEYALNFALNIQEIDKVLVGVNTEKQLREIVGSVKGQEQISFNADPIYDINLLNPSLWKL